MSLNRLFGGLALAAGLASSAVPASAQAVIAQMNCAGDYNGNRIEGLVLADLWYATGVASGGPTAGQMIPYLLHGDLSQIPGTVRLFGHMFDSQRNLVNFEVFMKPDAQGVGAYWINGARHREVHMRLVLGDHAFDIHNEYDETVHYTCEEG